MSEPQTNMVPVRDESEVLTSWGFSGAASNFLTSIQGDTPKDRAMSLRLENEEGIPFVDCKDQQLNVVAYLCKPVEQTNEQTGEVSRLLMTQLLLDNGKIVTSFSQYVLRPILAAKKRFGPPSHTNPIKIIARTRGKGSRVSHYADTSPMTEPLLSPKGGK